MVKISSLTAKFETGFQSFVLVIRHCEMNLDQDADQKLMKRI